MYHGQVICGNCSEKKNGSTRYDSIPVLRKKVVITIHFLLNISKELFVFRNGLFYHDCVSDIL